MKQKNDIEKKVDAALNSFEGIQRAEPQPWLFSRVKGKLMKPEDKTQWDIIGSILSKPVIAIAGLCLILMLNVFLLYTQKKESSSIFITQTAQPVENESLIASSSSFDYETLLQP